MDCEGLARLLSEHAVAELSQEERAAVGVHMAACEVCRKRWRLDEQSQEFHDAARGLRARPGAEHALLAKLDAEGSPSEPGRPAPQPDEPKRLGDFELVELIGRGGMGAVYKARQRSLGRDVAVKVLSRGLSADTTFVERFEREARAIAAVRHPNIIRVFSVGEGEGRRYIAMELVAGEGLSARLRREGSLPQDRALEVIKQVAAALAAAHEAGIIHRDIKPSNILITREGEVRLADFGLAKRLTIDLRVTATGAALGTPLYMPPEAGRGQPCDARSDLYSLGATFYHVLAGQPPFEGKGATELILKHAHEPPKPLSAVAPRVDRRLCQIIDRLLRKDPSERYPSARALLDDLEALGPLRAPTETERAEARATLRDATTAAFGQGRRREGGAAAGKRRQRPATRRALLVWALAATAAFVLLILVAIATQRDPRPTKEGSDRSTERKAAGSDAHGPSSSTPSLTAKGAMTPKPSPPVAARPFRVLVDASKGAGAWWGPQGRDGFDPQEPHQGSKLAAYLRSQGWDVRELARGMADMSGELKGVDLAIRFGDWRPHTPREVAAYQSFVRDGGSLLLAGCCRRTPRPDPVAEAFGIHFGKHVEKGTIGRWAEHPVTHGLRPLRFLSLHASVVAERPGSATPLAWLAEQEGSPTSGALVMGTMPHGKGKIIFLSTIFPLVHVAQPLTDRIFDFLSAPGDDSPVQKEPE